MEDISMSLLTARMRKTKGTRIRRSKADLVYDTFVFVIMVSLMIIIMYPLYFILIASISDPMLVAAGRVWLYPQGVTFTAYERIFADARIWNAYRNTLLYTSLGTTINVVLTICAGYALSRKDLRGRKFFLMMFAFTMFFSGGMIPTYMVVFNLGLVNTIWAMVIPNAVSIWNLLITRAFFQSTIPEELLDAAMIDGCGNLRFFALIILPLSKAIIAVMALFYAISHWNAFFNALIYLFDSDLFPLQLVLRSILIQNEMQTDMMVDVTDLMERQNLAELLKYGIIVVASVPALVIYPFAQKYFVTGIMIGSVKG